jgi:hypothetical protein
MSRCIAKLSSEYDYESNDDYLHEKLVTTLSAALFHFMLTICTLPPERRIRLDNLVLDIVVVPNLHKLKTKPEKSIIVQFINGSHELGRISRLESLQPYYKNIWLIWLIFARPLQLTTKYTTYYVLSNGVLSSKYSNVMMDIYNFLKQAGDKSFRFIH